MLTIRNLINWNIPLATRPYHSVLLLACPFNPSTTISFRIPERGIVTLKIFDILGREVATLVNGRMNAGVHDVKFDASQYSSGVYIYRIRAGDFTASRKLVLMK